MSLKKYPLKALALDFDGTLIKSNHIKDKAFEIIFEEWPMHKKQIMDWHLIRDSVDRNQKFRYFVQEILNEPGNEKLINNLVNKFSILTKKKIIKCPLVEGAIDFLEYYYNKIPIFLVSATPVKDLNEILFEIKLNKYFKQVYGSPINKKKVLKNIMLHENISENNFIYFGDSQDDKKAANSNKIPFIGVKSERLNSVISDCMINNFTDYFVKDMHNTFLPCD